MGNPSDLRLACYAGHRGEETPRWMQIGDRRLEVIAILDRWLAPEHRYFKCRGSDDAVYILRHDVAADSWELTLFARGTGPRDWGVTDRKRH